MITAAMVAVSVLEKEGDSFLDGFRFPWLHCQ